MHRTQPRCPPLNTAFAPLVVTVTANAAGASYREPVFGGSVTFTGPGTGADITPDPQTATIGATTSGQASITPTANGTAGGYTVTAAATGTTPASVAFTLTNTPGPVTHFALIGPPTAFAGEAYTVTVTAKDAGNNTVPGYTGTVRITTSDPVGRVPADHVFVAVDNGVATFAPVLSTDGTTTLTATDRANGTITGTLQVTIAGPAIYSVTQSPYGVTPISGPTTGGTTITIVGNGFTGTTSVLVGGVVATSFVVTSDTTLTAVTPAHAVGTVDVVVTTAVHSATASHAFTYVDAGGVTPPGSRPGPAGPGAPSPAPPAGGGPTQPGSPGVAPAPRP